MGIRLFSCGGIREQRRLRTDLIAETVVLISQFDDEVGNAIKPSAYCDVVCQHGHRR